jgi:hypothetical protein
MVLLEGFRSWWGLTLLGEGVVWDQRVGWL